MEKVRKKKEGKGKSGKRELEIKGKGEVIK